jgi:hypothetical protein
MTANANYSQKNVSVEIPIDFGKGINYGIFLLENEFDKRGIIGYKFVPVRNGTVILTGEGPYTKNQLLQIVKGAMLKDIKLEKGKKKSPLRSSFEAFSYYSRND